MDESPSGSGAVVPGSDLVRRAERWLAHDPDESTRAELRLLIDQGRLDELADRMSGRLQFGTAGLRGRLGAGPNRMNRAVVRQATAGLARYLLETTPDAGSRGVVVARDARRLSDVFARDVASVLAGHGILAIVFPERVPTPLGAFAVKELGAAAGVVVTASHNPPDDNGYKVYWGNAAQIIPPHDRGISDAIERAGEADAVPLLDEEIARQRGLWRDVDPELGERYLKAILDLAPHAGEGRDLTIVYTALHGVGGRWTKEALARAGFGRVHEVREQHEPDGRFPTVSFPNPEEPGALDLSLALAERVGADLLIANDPDADRLAAAARDREGRMRTFTGNELGVLLGHYCLTERPRPERPLVLTTIVSSAQLSLLASQLGARCEETLTGFKWIMNRALELSELEGTTCVFGYEEALGYTCGGVVRDKDGIGSALVFADLAAWCRARSVTVWEHLEDVQRRHGLFLSAQRAFTFPGREGAATIAAIMSGFRAAPPPAIAGLAVRRRKDFERRVAFEDGLESALALPPSNVLAFDLDGGSRVTLRPSGTEPKIKYYLEVRVEPGPSEAMSDATSRGEALLGSLLDDFLRLARERGQPALGSRPSAAL